MRTALLLAWLLLAAVPAYAQSGTDLESWFDNETERREREDEGQDAEDEAGRDAADLGVELTQWGVNTAVSADEALNDWEALDDAEADCGSAYTDAGAPTVPSSCADDPACEECYEEAVGKLDFNRFYIERARCITVAHVKMANSAMAFGDSASGVHGVAGLSWQLQGKPQIQEAVGKLKRTYTNKAGEYLQGIDNALRKLGQCEAKYYGERDWYERYGWIYLNFMKAKYSSPPE